MDEYISVGKKVLKVLLNNGYEAYFIGEAVRNSILKKNTDIVNIITNADNENIKRVFDGYNYEQHNYNCIKVEYENYEFFIQTFNTNEYKEKNAIFNKHYSRSLLDDLATRDFTINAIAMGYNGKIIDAFDGYNDIHKRRIKHIGNAKIKFKKNPELMIKAISLMSELNYKLANKTKRAINRRKKDLLLCDISLYMADFQKIFNAQYSKKAILMLNKTNLDIVLPLFKKPIRILGSKYHKVNFEEVLLMAFILDGGIDKRYCEYVKDYDTFIKIFDLACNNKTGVYDNVTLYTNGLEVCLEANYVNYLLGRSRKKTRKIKKLWNQLQIKNINDLFFIEKDFKKIINEKDYYIIPDILNEVAIAIDMGEINNTFEDIKEMVISLLAKNNILYYVNGNYTNEEINAKNYQKSDTVEKGYEINNDFEEQDSGNIVLENTNDYTTNQRLQYLEQKILEQSQLIKEQEQKIQAVKKIKIDQDIKDVTDKSIDLIKDNDQLKDKIKDDEDFKDQLQKFISNYIKVEEDEQ